MEILRHYFELERGPFLSLSALAPEVGDALLGEIRAENRSYAAQRNMEYLARRREIEQLVRERFVAKGGRPILASPHYMVWGECNWLTTWYEHAAWIEIPVMQFDPATVSFTYGDSFPTFSPRVQDGREYRNTVYTLDEIRDVIARFGLPNDWNADGSQGPERYVEAHVWSDVPIARYCSEFTSNALFKR